MNRPCCLHVITLALLWTGCAQHIAVKDEHGQLQKQGEAANGLREGPWTHFHPNGAKQSEGNYSRDVQDGQWRWWYDNGLPEMFGSFHEGLRTGPWRLWHRNGQLRAEGSFGKGLEQGAWLFYTPEGTLERRGWYLNGQPCGPWENLDARGQVLSSGLRWQGAKCGPWISAPATREIYPLPKDLQLVEETNRRSGMTRAGGKEGPWVSAHAGGAVRVLCTFEADQPQGWVSVHSRDGALMALGEVQRGAPLGAWWIAGQTVELETPRPRAPWDGDWSTAFDGRLDWNVLERWIAEASSALQPQPVKAPEPSAVPAVIATAEPQPTIPARLQPLTEFEERALPKLVDLYGTGAGAFPLAQDSYASLPVGRDISIAKPELVAKPGDLLNRSLPVREFFRAPEGRVNLDQYRNQRHVLLVVMRGFGGQVCIYCTSQLLALAKEREKLAAAQTEVFVVFPGSRSGMDAFLESYERSRGSREAPPFGMLYDADLELTKQLGIQDKLAVPSCFLIDKQGLIRWAHIGKDHVDRPSVNQILTEIHRL